MKLLKEDQEEYVLLMYFMSVDLKKRGKKSWTLAKLRAWLKYEPGWLALLDSVPLVSVYYYLFLIPVLNERRHGPCNKNWCVFFCDHDVLLTEFSFISLDKW